ncbi:DNA cytosine methyltransferase [Candidatus Electronema sp. JM]|uniref:DNA cytosine methyltransferase n=1 Tax=Candidatus Electronema sp. JM TaxID=3401571 RepID=UPI003AA93B12
MEFVEKINIELKPWIDNRLHTTVLDLFAGCGGLSLGFEAHGFRTIAYEMDEYAAETYNRNLLGKCVQETLTVDSVYPKADIVIGGPPCQPFSVGGKQLGLQDARDGFPIFLAAVKQLEPEVVLFENVRGMLYKNKWYLHEVVNALEKFGYYIRYSLLNAVDYEVPQNRERVIVIGAKQKINLPKKANKRIAAGQALGELALQHDDSSKFLTESMDQYVAKYEKASKCVTPRDLHLNKPARTLTCRNLAGSTGDMHRIRLQDGRRRRLTVREAARLQSFPDWFEFAGNETQQFNQIGNAVAPYFAYHLARQVKKYLLGNAENSSSLRDARQLNLFAHETIYQSRTVKNI